MAGDARGLDMVGHDWHERHIYCGMVDQPTSVFLGERPHRFLNRCSRPFFIFFPKVTALVTEGQEPWTRLPLVLTPVFLRLQSWLFSPARLQWSEIAWRRRTADFSSGYCPNARSTNGQCALHTG